MHKNLLGEDSVNKLSVCVIHIRYYIHGNTTENFLELLRRKVVVNLFTFFK